MKKLIYLFAVVAAVFAVSCSSTPATPGGAALNIYQLMVDGKYEAVAEGFYLDATDPDDIREGREFLVSIFREKAAPQIEKKGGIKSVEVLEESINESGDKAEVKLKITYGNDTTEEEDVNMVLDKDGKWKASMEK